MTDSGKHVNTHNSHSATDNESKSAHCPLGCPSDLAHFALIRLGNVGLLPKVLEAIAHIGVDLVDHFCEKDWAGLPDEEDWDSDAEEDLSDA